MSQVERPVLAIDHTAWFRPHAPTLKERTYEHQATALYHFFKDLIEIKNVKSKTIR